MVKRPQIEKDGKAGLYFPSPNMQIDPLLGKTKKFYAAGFYQLKIGHGAIGTFLKRIGATETAEYWWCGNAEQSVIHLYTKCAPNVEYYGRAWVRPGFNGKGDQKRGGWQSY